MTRVTSATRVTIATVPASPRWQQLVSKGEDGQAPGDSDSKAFNIFQYVSKIENGGWAIIKLTCDLRSSEILRSDTLVQSQQMAFTRSPSLSNPKILNNYLIFTVK